MITCRIYVSLKELYRMYNLSYCVRLVFTDSQRDCVSDIAILGECRLINTEKRGKHETDRQKSVAIDLSDPRVSAWYEKQREAYDKAKQAYKWAVECGIAKEVARSVLPLGITTKLYVAGTLRDFYHYCCVRCDEKTQKEHRQVATSIRQHIYDLFPILAEVDNER